MEFVMCCDVQFIYKRKRKITLRFDFNNTVHDQELARILIDYCTLSNRFYHDYFSRGTTYVSTDFDRMYLNGSWFPNVAGSSYRIKKIDIKGLLFCLAQCFGIEPIIKSFSGYHFSNFEIFFDSILKDQTILFNCVRRSRITNSTKILTFSLNTDDLELDKIIML